MLQSFVQQMISRIISFRETIPAPEFVVPLGLLAIATLLGFFIERLLLGRFVKTVSPSSWDHMDDIIIGALKWMVTLWFFLGGLYLALYSGSISPELFGMLDNVLAVAFVLSLGVVVNRVIRDFLRIYTTQVHGLPSSSVLMNASTLVVLIVVALIALQSIGISVIPILTALGVGGLAVALALQETLANFFSGIAIIISGQVRPGDYVRLDSGDEGYVYDITWRNTTIRTLTNNTVIVPNSTLGSSIVTNFYQPGKETSVILAAGVSYDSDLSRVEEVTLDVCREVLKEVEGTIPSTDPLVRYNTFGEYSIGFSIIVGIRENTDQYLVTHELMKRLHRRYDAEKIEIPFPVRTIRMAGDSPDEREGQEPR